MKSIGIRLTVLLLSAVMCLGGGGQACPAEEIPEPRTVQVSHQALEAMFSVLGLAFACAGGLVGLIVAKDPT